MYTLIRSIGVTALLARQLPILLVSFLIAETFYKFRSFTLETLAFLATWLVLDYLSERVARLMRTKDQRWSMNRLRGERNNR